MQPVTRRVLANVMGAGVGSSKAQYAHMSLQQLPISLPDPWHMASAQEASGGQKNAASQADPRLRGDHPRLFASSLRPTRALLPGLQLQQYF